MPIDEFERLSDEEEGLMKVVVTGGSGLLGAWVIKELIEHGYDVTSVDMKQPKDNFCKSVISNLNNYEEVYECLQGADAVIHAAAIPSPNSQPNEITFSNNVISTYHILEAAAALGIRKIVTASSESSYGFCYAKFPLEPKYVPLDEDHPQLPQDCYGLSKIVNEMTGDMFHRREQMQIVSFRFCIIIAPDNYKNFLQDIHTPEKKQRLLWNYIDARDAASACRLAIEAEGLGSVALNIVADTTCMDVKSMELLKACYPDIEIREEIKGYDAISSNKKAKKLLNWQPVHHWRNQI
jgi:nucleoside-diphosphate-sugar epimerase